MTTPLCLLAEKYGSDKVPSLLHSYTPFYDTLFRFKQVHRVLEIGILHGSSLRMWRDYFPEAQIFGLEINPDVLFQETRIRTMQCDASDPEQLSKCAKELGGNFDLVIDDASHVPDDQVTSGNVMWKFIAPGGLLVIEDVGAYEFVTKQLHHAHMVVRTAAQPNDDVVILIPGVR